MTSFSSTYRWVRNPMIVSAPMRLIAGAELAVEVSKAGGLGFIGSGNDQSTLEKEVSKARNLCGTPGVPLPIGIGFLNWGADKEESVRVVAKYQPAAVWFFAPRAVDDLRSWTKACRTASDVTQIWVQIGGVEEAREVAEACAPDVLVVQGGDAGGHGLNRAASVISLVPEVLDMLWEMSLDNKISKMPHLIAAGGIADGRGVAAALALGAKGVCMGTRFLASPEAVIANGYREEVLRARDGGQTTVRSSVYDRLRGTTDWPSQYGGRGVTNLSYEDAVAGVDWEENAKRYKEAVKVGDLGWGEKGRMTTYAGTGVGLVTSVQHAGEIVEEVREQCNGVLARLNQSVR